MAVPSVVACPTWSSSLYSLPSRLSSSASGPSLAASRKPVSDECTLADFDWDFNAKAIDRTQIEELATARSSAARTTLCLSAKAASAKAGSSNRWGRAGVVGYRVRYTTSAGPAHQSDGTPGRPYLAQAAPLLRRFDWLIIDEFAFDKIERSASPQAANLLYKIIDMRSQRSTTVVTNVDFDAWGAYLEDPPLAMAFLDRVVDGAIIIKINGKSYRAHRACTKKTKTTE